MKNKILIFTFSLFTALSCGKSENKPIINRYVSRNNKDVYLSDFKVFRDLLYKSDKINAKRYFMFPIYDEDIWYLIDSEGNLDASKPFTEKDFDKYFSKIFNKNFVNLLLKIKSEELFSKGNYTTKEIIYKEGNYEIRSKITAIYSKNNKLVLSFYSEHYSKNKKLSETMCSYTFRAINNHFIFQDIALAG